MQIIADEDAPLELPDTPEDLLGAAAMASDILRDRGRAIVRIAVDGIDVPYTRLIETLKDRPVDSCETISFVTEDVNKLVEDALRELEEHIPELPKVCHDLAAVFQSEDALSGFMSFQEIAAIWQHVKTREMQIASALDVDLAQCELHKKSLEAHHTELNNFLEEAVQAMEARDTVLLGDLLEYELAPRADLEVEIVALLKQSAMDRRSA